MMFDFLETEKRKVRELEHKVEELENQVKHWKSLYERELKGRKVVVKYANNKQEIERIRSILKVHHDSRSKKMKQMIIEELYLDYGVVKKPSNLLLEYWKEQ